MSKVEELLLKDLPETVIDAAMREIFEYCIGFFRVESTPSGHEAVLLGSGILVSIGPTKAVLTAHHVLSILPRTGRLGFILSPTPHPHLPQTVDTQGLVYLPIARGVRDADGPDLGAVVLVPSIASTIAAKKTFYNIESRRDQMLHSPPDLRDGFWFINGFVDEYTVKKSINDGRGVLTRFYNLSGAGGPEKLIIDGDYDYFGFPVSYRARSVAPKTFGGMSGGGLWQVPLKYDAEQQIRHKTPLLSGIVFYQEPTTEGYCGVKCHGRQSIYRVAYEAVQALTRTNYV